MNAVSQDFYKIIFYHKNKVVLLEGGPFSIHCTRLEGAIRYVDFTLSQMRPAELLPQNLVCVEPHVVI